MAKDVKEDFNEGERLPDKELIASLLQKTKEVASKTAELRADLKPEYDYAAEKGVNVKAFKIFAKIMKVEQEQERESIVAHLEYYLGQFGHSAQLDMFGHNSRDAAVAAVN